MGERGSALVGEGLREAVFRSEVQRGAGTEGGGHGLNYIFKGTCDVKKPSMRPGCQQALGGLLLPQSTEARSWWLRPGLMGDVEGMN